MSESFPTASSFFHDFKYRRRLGSGGVGYVDLYVHETTGKQMAVKVVSNKIDEKYMTRSIEALETLHHPHMLTYYGHLITAKEYYLLFEYLPAQDLLRHAQQQEGKRVQRMRVVKWMRQITLALQYLHSNGKIHRDVKPPNVLLTSLDWDEADAKLADFDTVRDMEDSKSMNVDVKEKLKTKNIGTQPYLAPESCSQVYNEKVDVWSLGCMTYQLLTGRLPFTVFSTEEFQNGPTYLPCLDSAAKEFIQQCLIFNPEDRFSCEQLLNTSFLAPYSDSLVRPHVSLPFLSGSMPAHVLEGLLMESFHSVMLEGLQQATLFALLSPAYGNSCAENVLRQARMDLELYEFYAQQNPGFEETFQRLTAQTRAIQDFAEQCRSRM